MEIFFCLLKFATRQLNFISKIPSIDFHAANIKCFDVILISLWMFFCHFLSLVHFFVISQFLFSPSTKRTHTQAFDDSPTTFGCERGGINMTREKKREENVLKLFALRFTEIILFQACSFSRHTHSNKRMAGEIPKCLFKREKENARDTLTCVIKCNRGNFQSCHPSAIRPPHNNTFY